MSKLIARVFFGIAFLVAACCLLSPRLSTAEVMGLFFIVASATL
ncbi:hypothetical protein ACSC95_06075 [Burkholderia vietnamiensis]